MSKKVLIMSASTGGGHNRAAKAMKDEIEKTGKSLEQLAKEFVMANRPSSVIQRAATVEEVANMVIYVCSPQASATSGAALRVDGGVVDDII